MTVKSRRANNLRTWGKDLSRKFRRICSVCPRPSTHETYDGVLFCDEHYWQWCENQIDTQFDEPKEFDDEEDDPTEFQLDGWDDL